MPLVELPESKVNLLDVARHRQARHTAPRIRQISHSQMTGHTRVGYSARERGWKRQPHFRCGSGTNCGGGVSSAATGVRLDTRDPKGMVPNASLLQRDLESCARPRTTPMPPTLHAVLAPHRPLFRCRGVQHSTPHICSVDSTSLVSLPIRGLVRRIGGALTEQHRERDTQLPPMRPNGSAAAPRGLGRPATRGKAPAPGSRPSPTAPIGAARKFIKECRNLANHRPKNTKDAYQKYPLSRHHCPEGVHTIGSSRRAMKTAGLTRTWPSHQKRETNHNVPLPRRRAFHLLRNSAMKAWGAAASGSTSRADAGAHSAYLHVHCPEPHASARFCTASHSGRVHQHP